MRLQSLCLAISLITSTAAAQTNLVAHYRLDETSGTMAEDSSGNGNHGTYTGAGVTLGQAGICGGSTAVDFDGATGHVAIPSSPSLDALSSDFTVAAWIRPDVLGLMRVFANQRLGGAGGAWAFGPLNGTGGMRFTTLGVQDYDQASSLTAGNWHHIALVFDASFRASFYLDGALQGAVAGSAPANAPNAGWFIAVLDLTGIMEYFDGLIDDVQVYSGSATDAEIQFLFQNPCATIGGISGTLCSGDGGDQMGCTNCPCGNNAMPGTVGGCINSTSSSSRLAATGSSSISQATLRFEASGATPMHSCMLFSGNTLAPTNVANPCFGMDSGVQSIALDGIRCVVQGVVRHGMRPADANGDVGLTTDGWGSPSAFTNFAAFAAGGTKHFQVIYTDDANAVCQTGRNTSQAISVTFQP